MPFGSILGPVIGGGLGALFGASDQGANTSTQGGQYSNTGPFSSLVPQASQNINDFLISGVASGLGQDVGQAMLNNALLNQVPGGSLAANAASMAQGAGTPISSADISAYMNPYLGDVANQASTLAKQFLTEQALPAVQDSFISAGQPGSTRNADFTDRAIRDVTTNLQTNLGNIYGSGFNTALNTAQEQKRNQLAASGALANQAQQGFSNLENLGALSLNTAQAAGQGTGSGTSSGQFTGPSPSILGSAIGGAALGANSNIGSWLSGLFGGGGGGFTGIGASPYKDGGPVRFARRGALSMAA